MSEESKLDVLAVLERDKELHLALRNDPEANDESCRSVEIVRDVLAALKAYDRWIYEAESARVNGESIYSYADFQDMRKQAIAAGIAALARIKD